MGMFGTIEHKPCPQHPACFPVWLLRTFRHLVLEYHAVPASDGSLTSLSPTRHVEQFTHNDRIVRTTPRTPPPTTTPHLHRRRATLAQHVSTSLKEINFFAAGCLLVVRFTISLSLSLSLSLPTCQPPWPLVSFHHRCQLQRLPWCRATAAVPSSEAAAYALFESRG